MCERPDQVRETFRERPEAQSSRNLSAAVVLLQTSGRETLSGDARRSVRARQARRRRECTAAVLGAQPETIGAIVTTRGGAAGEE